MDSWHIFRISFADYTHERLLSLCAIMGLASVLAPLLVLYGLKSGIIGTMINRLVDDPRNMEITPTGSGHYNDKWIENIASRADVRFIIFNTRSIAASMALINSQPNQKRVVVDLIPTAKGDPLIGKWGRIPRHNNEIVLSEPAARKLSIAVNQTVTGRIGRIQKGLREQVEISLKITAILPVEAFDREAAFVSPDLLLSIEDYRDGFESKTFGWPGIPRNKNNRVYASFRLYARSIYDVMNLRNYLLNQDINVYARASEIETIQNLENSLVLIFSLISVVAIVGYFLSMTSSVLANVNRKRRYLGILRLIGFSTMKIIWFPIVQSICTCVIGTTLAIIIYEIVEKIINNMFQSYIGADEYICHLILGHVIIAFLFTLVLSILASLYAAGRAAQIEPSEVIRDV